MDSDADLSLFPMEVKFLTHWFERLSVNQPTYTDLNEFFLGESKIRLMDHNLRDEADMMNSGRIDFLGFDFAGFEDEMGRAANRAKDVEIRGAELFKKFILDIHETLHLEADSHLLGPVTNLLFVLVINFVGWQYAAGVTAVNPCLLNVLHDCCDDGVFAVRQAVDINFVGILEEFIDQNRILRGRLESLSRKS